MNKKVSFRLFVTVVWKGICQFFGWIGYILGFKDESRYGRSVKRIISGSIASVFLLMAITIAYLICTGLYDEIANKFSDKGKEYTYQYISRYIDYYYIDGGKGYLCESNDGTKTLDGIVWIAKPIDGDSLICFSNGKKRGYFNMYTGKCVIEPKYEKAWIFSDGVAAVKENGLVYFINHSGKKINDKTYFYDAKSEGYLYRNGYCPMNDDKGNIGLIDKSGNWAVNPTYSAIIPCSRNYWEVSDGKKYGVLSDSLKMIIPCNKYSIWVKPDNGIEIVDTDNVSRIYDYDGSIRIDFTCMNINDLTYNKEINPDTNEAIETYAKCKSYTNSNGDVGLLGKDGKPITKPVYQSIEAIEYDLYYCSFEYGAGIIIDGMGKQVE